MSLDVHILLRALVDELARCGITDAVTSPGSRNTPILLALVRDGRLRAHSQIDERCAGFFALGLAKTSGRPVALTCTSGTAAANLAPAVIEAHEAGVPLIILTADRPPELRDVGAGQTIDQIKLYGGAVRLFAEPDLETATPQRLAALRALACRAYLTSLEPRPGPVHLNLPLREPLAPGEPLPPGVDGRPDGRPWVSRLTAARPADAADVARTEAAGGLPPIGGRAVIVAGTGPTGSEARNLAALAERAGIPLLADPLSGARRGAAAIARYDHLLRIPALAARLAPDVVIRVGDLPTSKPLRTWLSGLATAKQIALPGDRAWPDPDASVALRITGPLDAALTIIARELDRAPEPGWLRTWRAADAAAERTIEREIARSGLSEPAVAAVLAEALPAGATLFVAASMPIRDIESFSPVREGAPRVLSNRGANGIDGTVSSAFGAAAAGMGPVFLLIGDVALAHDIGGLIAARRLRLELTIVLINNDGGGIFHFLPVAGERDTFEQHVATPHGLDFAAAAQLYGCCYERIETVACLRQALDRDGATGTRILEIQTDRAENLALHRRIAQAVAERLAEPVQGSRQG